MLSKMTDDSQGKHWYNVFPGVEFALNNTVNKSTGESPSMLLFGCRQRGKIVDKMADYLHDSKDSNKKNLEMVRNDASEKIRQTQQQSELRVNKIRKQARKYKTGDLVLLKNFDSTPQP